MSAIEILPPLSEINKRLTENERERTILNGLARLHARRLQWANQAAQSGEKSGASGATAK